MDHEAPAQFEALNARIGALIARYLSLKDPQIGSDEMLAQDLGADSLDVTAIMHDIEELLGVSLPDSAFELDDITFGELCDMVGRSLPAHPLQGHRLDPDMPAEALAAIIGSARPTALAGAREALRAANAVAEAGGALGPQAMDYSKTPWIPADHRK